MEYVVGFLFKVESGMKQVLLIHKERPDWQKGRLNGPGGKVKKDELAPAAMRREFLEEAGVDVPEWRWFCTLRLTSQDRVHFLTANAKPGDPQPFTTTDERVEWFDVEDVIHGLQLIPNLRWLLPMALDKDKVFGEIYDPS